MDAARATIDAVPLPPPNTFSLRRYEGGFRAPSERRQAFGRLLRVVKMFEYAQDDPELTSRLESELDRRGGRAPEIVGRLERFIQPLSRGREARAGRLFLWIVGPRPDHAVIIDEGFAGHHGAKRGRRDARRGAEDLRRCLLYTSPSPRD